jgi:hypothetical protein
MKTTNLILIVALLIFALLLPSCALLPATETSEPQAQLPVVEPDQAPTQPIVLETAPVEPSDPDAQAAAEVAVEFYEAYIAAIENFQPTIGSPEFEAAKFLSPAYLQQFAQIHAGFDGFGFDPVLQAQNIPPQPTEIKEVSLDGDLATVVLQFGRGAMEQPFERTVSLEKVDGQWLIVPDRVEDMAASPQDTVEAYYAWYLAYIGAEGEPRNPLVDRAYRAGPYLDPMFIANIDLMLEQNEIFFDPFLCAQDVPSHIEAIASYDNGSRPVVLAESSFAGHYILLDLARANFNQWSIRNITCGNSPAGVAKAFYTWALDYMTSSGEMRNPWVDGAHHQSPFLSQGFIQELDNLYNSGEMIPADPVFMAQDLPRTFTTAPCPEPDCALVNMQFGDTIVNQLRVEMVAEEGSLRIASISPSSRPQPAELEGWVPFIDGQYGYAVRYPAGWIVKGLNLADQHTPEQHPLMRSLLFLPDRDSEFPPFNLDVVVWPSADLSAAYSLGQMLEETQVNGYTAQVYRSDPGIIYYVFQHPSRPGTWIILGDYVTQFPGREDFARSVDGLFQTFVSTIALQ